MLGSREFRELLIAEIAADRQVASVEEVCFALQRFWPRRDTPGLSFEGELRALKALPPDALRPVVEEADRRIASAGSSRDALSQRGLLRRSVVDAIAGPGTRAISAKAPTGPSLREVPRDRYTDFLVAGEGGQGVVYQALDTVLDRYVAFKMIRPDAGVGEAAAFPSTPLEAACPEPSTDAGETFEEMRVRFLQEALITGALEHPGIVPVYELGQTPRGIPYYTMRFVRGQRTMAHLIEELRGKPLEERWSLLDPFLRLCDTVRYAHSRGVLHRDLKPQNVAIGEYGEVVLLDWGLARVLGREDRAASRWQARIRRLRETHDFRTDLGAVGTPGYMSWEAATGNGAAIDARSDVFSLGAILYEILTGRMPFEFQTFLEYFRRLQAGGIAPPSTLDAEIPEALSDLCVRAMAKNPAERPSSVEDLVAEIRQWRQASTTEREIERFLREARRALNLAEDLAGTHVLKQVERAAAALEQVRQRAPEHRGLARLVRDAEAVRQRGLAERDRATARRVVLRLVVAVLVLGPAVTLAIHGLLDAQVRRAEEAEAAKGRIEQTAQVESEKAVTQATRASEASARNQELATRNDELRSRVAELEGEIRNLARERDETRTDRDRVREESTLASARVAALEGDLSAQRLLSVREREAAAARERLAAAHRGILHDLADVQDLVARGLALLGASDLTGQDAMVEAWLEQARAAVKRRPQQSAAVLGPAVASGPDAPDPAVLADIARLAAVLDRLQDPGDERTGVLAEVAAWHAARQRTADQREHDAPLWEQVRAEVARSWNYRGLALREYEGLVPLGADPVTGFQEFAVRGTGVVPGRRGREGRLELGEEFAVILVLLPGDRTFWGSQRSAGNGRNYDPNAAVGATSTEVTVPPFFLSKYECTQAQWSAVTGGRRPSGYPVGSLHGGEAITPHHPVERVSWEEARTVLKEIGLRLPDEYEWEYACRARTETPWSTGAEPARVYAAANLWDGGRDGTPVHGRVGRFPANAFGFHDMHGNVAEWCLPVGPRPSRALVGAVRGGSWNDPPRAARSSTRRFEEIRTTSPEIGVRPAMSL